MKNRRVWIIRIVAIILAALMILSVGAVLIQTLALDGVPATGTDASEKIRTKSVVFVLIGAVVLIALCVVPPMLKKKK